MAARLTQAALEVLLDGVVGKARLTQANLEVLLEQHATARARLTQAVVEALISTPSKVRLAQAALEFLLGPTVEDSGSVTCSIKINPPDVQPITCSIFIEERTEDDILCETINGV